jgi:guanine nucleotide-binding protein G(i) subunit alpha
MDYRRFYKDRKRLLVQGSFDFGTQLSISVIDPDGLPRNCCSRRKTLHFFDSAVSLILPVDLAQYDAVLPEDESQTRIMAALSVFESIVSCKTLAGSSIILVLFNVALFGKQLKQTPVSKYFPDCTAGDNQDDALDYIVGRFTAVNRVGKQMYTYIGELEHPEVMTLMVSAVKDTMLNNALRQAGISRSEGE